MDADQVPPVPDPTVLTTEALQREIFILRQSVEQQVEALNQVLSERIRGHKGVREQEFSGVRDKFHLIERQRVEQKADTKDAVDAALAAAKEAVGKSEMATAKSIDELGGRFEGVLEGQRRDIDDLKGEGWRRRGGQETTVERRDSVQPFQVALLTLAGSGITGVVVALVAT